MALCGVGGGDTAARRTGTAASLAAAPACDERSALQCRGTSKPVDGQHERNAGGLCGVSVHSSHVECRTRIGAAAAVISRRDVHSASRLCVTVGGYISCRWPRHALR